MQFFDGSTGQIISIKCWLCNVLFQKIFLLSNLSMDIAIRAETDSNFYYPDILN